MAGIGMVIHLGTPNCKSGDKCKWLRSLLWKAQTCLKTFFFFTKCNVIKNNMLVQIWVHAFYISKQNILIHRLYIVIIKVKWAEKCISALLKMKYLLITNSLLVKKSIFIHRITLKNILIANKKLKMYV